MEKFSYGHLWRLDCGASYNWWQNYWFRHITLNSLQYRRFLRARKWFAHESACWNSKRGEKMGRVIGLLFLLSLIFLRHNKDGGYNSTNINKQLLPAQNPPAQQAILWRTFPLVCCSFHTASRQYCPAVQGMCKRKYKENYIIVPTIILLLPIIAQKYPCTASDWVVKVALREIWTHTVNMTVQVSDQFKAVILMQLNVKGF